MPKADQIRSRRKSARKRAKQPPVFDLWEGQLGGDALKAWREDKKYGRVPPPPPTANTRYRKRSW